MLKIQWFLIRSYLYWTLLFRFVWYVIIYQGEGNIPIEKIRHLRKVITFKGKTLGYSSLWVREKLASAVSPEVTQ